MYISHSHIAAEFTVNAIQMHFDI